MVVIVVMIVMWTCHVDVVHTRILQAEKGRKREREKERKERNKNVKDRTPA